MDNAAKGVTNSSQTFFRTAEMSLLPKSATEFSSKEYWDAFFTARGIQNFEWYGEFNDFYSILCNYIRLNDAILVAGCGNSTLSAELYTIGYKNIVNTDISEIVIEQMQMKYSHLKGMKWIKCDVTKTGFEQNTFSCILDKGTLDALMPTETENKDIAQNYFKEIYKLLKIGGRFICISLLQEHILSYILNWFSEKKCLVRIIRCEERRSDVDDKSRFSFPVFIVICTKFKTLANFKPILEVQILNSKIRRVETKPELIDCVKIFQQYAYMQYMLNVQSDIGECVSFELVDSESLIPRYYFFVINNKKKGNSLQFAVFIVPDGREHEWLFGTKEGRLHLAQNAKCSRLVVVHLAREQTFTTMQAVQDELSSKVMELAPPGLSANTKVPFLSTGNDVESRIEKHRGVTQNSGEYIVEDVICNGHFRRLLFSSNLNIIQSEAKLINRGKKHGKKASRLNIDYSYLACDFHLAMIGGLDMENLDSELLLIGLGGGLLAMYINKCFSKINITAVEIDPDVKEIAEKWFGFQENTRMKVIVDDGIQYISQLAKNGTFILNLACRNEVLKSKVLDDLKLVFPYVLCQNISDDINTVVFCKSFIANETCFTTLFRNNLVKLKKHLLKVHSQGKNIIDVEDIMKSCRTL